MYDWGDRAQHSAAAYRIIREARERESLTILVLGALTNVASAVFIEPEIAAKLKVYWLGTSMDFKTGVLNSMVVSHHMPPALIRCLNRLTKWYPHTLSSP